MPAGSTYTPIATTTLGSTTASYTFSSIPSTYTDLVLIASGTTGSSNYIGVYLNGDSGTNYSVTIIDGNGTGATSDRVANTSNSYTSYFGTGQSVTIANFMNYANTTTYKTILTRHNSQEGTGTGAVVNLWRSTAAINSIQIRCQSATTFSVGTTFTLYGIAAA